MRPHQSHLNDVAKPKTARLTLWIAVLGITGLLAWASVSEIGQVTRAQAQIIASERTQEIQAPEGGVLSQLLVAEGEDVKKGQLLAVLEEERAQAAVDDSSGKVAALKITVARLEAEVYGTPLVFDESLKPYKQFIRNQTSLYNKRRKVIEQDVASLKKMLGLAQEELRLNEPLLKYGDVSRADIIKLRRQVADIEAQIANKENKYFQDAQADMTKAQEELRTQQEQLRDRNQVLEEKTLEAPTDGVVKNIQVTTIGGVVRPGEIVMEILPTSSDLVVEAKVSPADIAFIKLKQTASVKLDAYDFSIFGAMVGEVIYISPDTLEEDTPKGKQPYYRVQIRIKEAEFKGRGEEIVIRPGMTASVDIKAKDRTVLSYLTKPITKTLSQGMGER